MHKEFISNTNECFASAPLLASAKREVVTATIEALQRLQDSALALGNIGIRNFLPEKFNKYITDNIFQRINLSDNVVQKCVGNNISRGSAVSSRKCSVIIIRIFDVE